MGETWEQMGREAARDDAAQGGDPCATIDEARVRIGVWLRGTYASDAEVEACAQGYLAGWQATTKGAA